MQIFYIPGWLMIISYIILWPVFQVSIAMIGNKVSDKFFNPQNFWLKTRKWEKNGLFYKRIFKVDKWKPLLPDGAKANKEGFSIKHIGSYDPENIEKFIAETGRSEIFHWIQILPFWVFGLWSPGYVVFIMLGYALIVNLPCIIAQRYNRPRLVKTYEYLKIRQGRKVKE